MYLEQNSLKISGGFDTKINLSAAPDTPKILLVSAHVTGYTISRFVTGATKEIQPNTSIQTGAVISVASDEVIMVPTTKLTAIPDARNPRNSKSV